MASPANGVTYAVAYRGIAAILHHLPAHRIDLPAQLPLANKVDHGSNRTAGRLKGVLDLCRRAAFTGLQKVSSPGNIRDVAPVFDAEIHDEDISRPGFCVAGGAVGQPLPDDADDGIVIGLPQAVAHIPGLHPRNKQISDLPLGHPAPDLGEHLVINVVGQLDRLAEIVDLCAALDAAQLPDQALAGDLHRCQPLPAQHLLQHEVQAVGQPVGDDVGL